jgi:hypothetical protein
VDWLVEANLSEKLAVFIFMVEDGQVGAQVHTVTYPKKTPE